MKKIKVGVGDFRITRDERRAIKGVLDSGRLSEWKKVREFEVAFARWLGRRYGVCTNSGTSALIAGMSALSHDRRFATARRRKVITSPLTYVATVNALVLSGFEPVFVDVDPRTFVITPGNIAACLGSGKDADRCCAILPVHLMGYPCDMKGIRALAKKHGLVIIEDSAQAHGSIYGNKKTGTFSLFSIFSFYVAHNIQAGEMGILTTDDGEIARLVRKIKSNGRLCECEVCTRTQGYCPLRPEGDDTDPRFCHDMVGYNFKTMEFPAALGLTQLKKAGRIIRKRQENVKYLNDGLAGYRDLFQLPVFSERVSYLAYPLVIKRPRVLSRQSLREKLERSGIETRPLFGCIPTQQPAYRYLKKRYAGKLPHAEYLGMHGFYIGCHQYLSRRDLDYVIETFAGIVRRLTRT